MSLGGTIFDGRLERHDVLTSTIDRCRALADEGAAEGAVVLALSQSAGRGQRGHSWFSPPGTGLYLSALLRPPLRPEQLPLLPLVAGVAACEALRDDFAVAAWMKHPNDLLVVHAGTLRKLGGLLVDSAVQGEELRHVIVSLGLNCESPPGGFPADLAPLAATLEELGVAASGEDVARSFLTRLASWRGAMEERAEAWAADVARRHAALLRAVLPGQAADDPSPTGPQAR